MKIVSSIIQISIRINRDLCVFHPLPLLLLVVIVDAASDYIIVSLQDHWQLKRTRKSVANLWDIKFACLGYLLICWRASLTHHHSFGQKIRDRKRSSATHLLKYSVLLPDPPLQFASA